MVPPLPWYLVHTTCRKTNLREHSVLSATGFFPKDPPYDFKPMSGPGQDRLQMTVEARTSNLVT